MLLFLGWYFVPGTPNNQFFWMDGRLVRFSPPNLIIRHDFFQSTPTEQCSVHPGWLDYIGDDEPTQLYRDYFISHSKDPVINQPGIQMECHDGMWLLFWPCSHLSFFTHFFFENFNGCFRGFSGMYHP